MNIGALDFKMSIKHVHGVYERACKFGVRRGDLIQLLEAPNGDDFGRQIVAIGIHYVASKTKSQTPTFALAIIGRITRGNSNLLQSSMPSRGMPSSVPPESDRKHLI